MSELKGIIYIEARIKDKSFDDANIDCISYEKLQAELEHQLSSENLSYELLENILDDARSE
ncbi:putative pachytene checkpoint component pch2 [Golovinomyces cichoracearum]|uniref:Putative pachytene checkpoint component pch2 n=1 Tax=Golovinomyces cichoracearum TaxID=62708 RepID=A0A420J566_9PEZI|nr:putative pachytene checkpoint component pch2 [Golovinomyces cichoracearum]